MFTLKFVLLHWCRRPTECCMSRTKPIEYTQIRTHTLTHTYIYSHVRTHARTQTFTQTHRTDKERERKRAAQSSLSSNICVYIWTRTRRINIKCLDIHCRRISFKDNYWNVKLTGTSTTQTYTHMHTHTQKHIEKYWYFDSISRNIIKFSQTHLSIVVNRTVFVYTKAKQS